MIGLIMVGRKVGQYVILEAIGDGGMGVVYKARDTQLGRLVAIKFMRPDRTAEHAVNRFFQEARAASALNHPNIVTVHELEEAETGSYLVMELVEGLDLRSMRGKANPLDILLPIVAQAAEALSIAHAVGIVHRDIKPENIMLRADGYIKILDFGLARAAMPLSAASDVETANMTSPGTLLGTPRYMSPEQTRALPLMAESDIFSLGVVLYELATGHHPFARASAISTLQAISSEIPVVPSRLNPSIPTDIDALILSMLEKDGRRRPTANEVRQSLKKAMHPHALHLPRLITGSQTIQMVGRQRELEQLQQLLDSAANGSGSFVCITGEPGLGKSTLVEGFLAGCPEIPIARGRCSERLAGAGAYLPVLEAMEGLAHRNFSTSAAAQVMKTVAPTWYREIGSFDESSSARAAVEAQGALSQERMKREILALLQDLTRTYPLVLCFEDVHWADLSTVDLLSYLGNHLPGMRLLVILTYRPSDLLLAAHAFRNVQLELQTKNLLSEIRLSLLTGESVADWLAVEFPNHDFPCDFEELLMAKTEGNPLFLAGVMREMSAHGAVAHRDGRFVLTQTVISLQREFPATVRSMIDRKIERLSEENRQLFAVAAVQGYEFDSAVIAIALQTEPEVIEDRLAELERVHMLVHLEREGEFPDGTLNRRYRFVHGLYQNSLHEALGPSRRAKLSLSVAKTLRRLHGSKSVDIAAELAMLYEAGRDFPVASIHYLAAMRNAIRVCANQETIVLGQRGLACLTKTPESSERYECELAILLIMGSALMAVRGFGGEELPQVFKRAKELCERQGLGSQQLAAVRGLWAFHLVRAEYAVALDLSEQLLDLARSGNDAAWVEAHLALGFTYSHMGKSLEAAEHLRAGIAAADRGLSPDRALAFPLHPAIACRGQMATHLWYLGYPDRALATAQEALAIAEQLRSPYEIGWSKMYLAIVHELRGEVEQDYEYAQEALTLANEYCLREVQGWSINHHGWALVHKGHAEEGLKELLFYVSAQKEMGSKIALPNTMAQLAECFLHEQRYDEGLAAIHRGLEIGRSNGELYYEAELYRLRGVLLLHKGGSNLDEVEECFRTAIRLAHERDTKSWELRAALSLAEFLHRAGRIAEARGVLQPVYAWFSEGNATRDLTEARNRLEQLNEAGVSAGV
jgi:tetratricopeptide (TPR) repeat protein/tRNA A-37 threonylcarbamoyl transferase component Bud32